MTIQRAVTTAVWIMFSLFWLAFAVNLVAPLAGTTGEWINNIGLLLIAVHILELVINYKKLKAINHASAKDLLLIILFGTLYWKPLLAQHQTKG